MIVTIYEILTQITSKKELMELDAVLIEKLSIYLIGGVVMEINDLKPEEILSQSKNADYAE